jgi:DNA-binding MarR family transcriptional regulator
VSDDVHPAPSGADVAEQFFGLAHLLRKHANAGLRAEGLTMARGKLLAILEHHGLTRISSLADRLHIAPRSVTEAVDALERDGLVRREPDPTDRRAVLVGLTDPGRTLIEGTLAARREVSQGLFAVLSDADRAELARILDVVWTAADSEPTPRGRSSDPGHH